MDDVKKQKSISKVFALYIVCFCIVTIFIGIVDVISFQFGINSGFILPANYYEQQVERHRKDIAEVEVKNIKSFIPDQCIYAVYDLNGEMMQGNISKDTSVDIWKILQKNRISDGSYYYKPIQRENEICVIGYTMRAQFSNKFLQKTFPNSEFYPIVFF